MSYRAAFIQATGLLLTLELPLLFASIAVLYAFAPSSRRRLAAAALLAASALGFFALAAAAVAWGIGGPDAARTVRALGRLAATLAAINSAGVLLFDIVMPRLRARLSALARDLILAAAYAMAILGALSASGLNLTGLLATSAVMTAIVAFSLQDTLGNVLGGMVLQLDQTLKPGDWVKVADDEGVVREIRWRQTQIATTSGDLVVVPNSQLMKGVVVALGRREDGRSRRTSFSFNVPLTSAPSRIIDVVEKALSEDLPPFAAPQPAPSVLVTELLEGRAAYAARFWITDFSKTAEALSAARTRAFYALARAGIELAEPPTAILFEDGRAAFERRAAEEADRRLAALRGVDLFSTLTEGELATLVARVTRAPFARGETLTRQGADGDWLYILAKGEAEVLLEGAGGAERVARLRAGDYIGEMALLTGAPRSATVVAASDVECYRLDADAFRGILARRPEAAESVAQRLASRRAELEKARGALDTRSQESASASAVDLLSRIRRFFALS